LFKTKWIFTVQRKMPWRNRWEQLYHDSKKKEKKQSEKEKKREELIKTQKKRKEKEKKIKTNLSETGAVKDRPISLCERAQQTCRSASQGKSRNIVCTVGEKNNCRSRKKGSRR
jgi:hypothetical protein